MLCGVGKEALGLVKIYSEVFPGTTVPFYLPRLGREAARATSGAAASPHIPSGGETVLLVEDDPDVRGFVASLLHDLGYVVLTAADGPAAWKILDTDRSEEHTSELQSLMRISYAVFCLKKKKHTQEHKTNGKPK